MSNAPEIAVIGGGTGNFTLLNELKEFTPDISAIVNMSDDGGSTGVLRDEFGVLPPGDVRQCLVALSDTPELRDLFNYRFGGDGSLAGHTIGNLLLTGLELQQGSFDKAIKLASVLLHITGRVIPVTLDKHTLVLHDDRGRIEGEHNIGHLAAIRPGAYLSHDPPAHINPEAATALKSADLVVVAPGNLYGSLLPTLAIDGMREALSESTARKVMVANLVTKPGQTDSWHVVDYVHAMERYIGEGAFDIVLYNQDHPSPELLQKYAADGEYPVETAPDRFAEIQAEPIAASLVAKDMATQDRNDKAIRRTLIRHDAHQVGRQLMRVFYG